MCGASSSSSAHRRACPDVLRPEGSCSDQPSTLNQPFALMVNPMPLCFLSRDHVPRDTSEEENGWPSVAFSCGIQVWYACR